MTQSLKVRVPVPFPAFVAGDSGISVTKENGVWTIALDATDLSVVTVTDPTTKQIIIFDPTTGEYDRTSMAAINQAPLSFRNILAANGGLEVWQRGAGSVASIAVGASATAYTADRWYLSTGANQASTVSAQAGLTNNSFLCGRIQRNNGQTGTAAMVFAYPLTTDELYKLRGQLAVLSFAASAGANWSPSSGTLTYKVYVGTGAVAKRNATPYTGETNPISGTVNLTAGGSVQSIISAISAALPTNINQAEIQFTWTPTGTAGANDWFSIDDVQLETVAAGTTTFVPQFERRLFATELALCQRHYCKTFQYGTAPAQNQTQVSALGIKAQAAADVSVMWNFPQQMRAIPTITTYNPAAANANWRDVTAGSDKAVTVDPDALKSAERVLIAGAAGSAGDNLYIHAAADASI